MDASPVEQLRSAIAQPPPALVAACDSPIALPEGALSAGTVERLWGRDRASLMSCGERNDALRRFYRTRDAGLAGDAPVR